MHTLRMAAFAVLAVLAALSPAARAQDAGKDAAKGAAPPEAKPPALQPWEFPREFQAAGRKVFLHEPSLVARDDATGDVKLRFPASIQDGAGRIWWGAIEAAGTSHLDLNARLVLVDRIASGAVVFAALGEQERDEITKGVPDAFPKELVLRLEILTAGPGAAPPEPASPPKLSMAAPEILVRRTPAVLVQVDGAVEKDAVAEFPLEYVLNTAADVFHDPKSGTWFLLADGAWLEAKKLEGPWKLAAQLPVLLSQLDVKHPRGHVRLFVPGTPEFNQRTGGKKPAPPAVVPEVIVRDKPAELVLLEGDPLFTMVPGVKLLAVANTESDLLYHPKSAQFLLLVAGRWFAAEDLAGPWKEAFGGLPEELGRIPRDHVRGHVAWCVPGTPEAAEAAALASMEERVTMSRVTAVEVAWDKEPRFVAIDGTPVKVATTTEDDVFQTDGAFWCCSKGVWFRSDDGKSGWTPAAKIPAALEQLPETAPGYHARFCKALGAAENGIRFGATGPYSGVFLWKGAPVHGTGFSRRGLLRSGNWYPSQRTWGENRWYDPLTGVFQPRTVEYTAEMKPVASEWSPYTASYGRVRAYADRYGQGGRRMFPFTPDVGRLDTSAARPWVWESWGTQVKSVDGMDPARLPLGDRTAETPRKDPAVVADAEGRVWRRGAKGFETYKDQAWAAQEGIGDREKAWLDAFARIDARPAQLRAWAASRRAPLPVNPTVTK